ncbi:hypothetical protein QUH73_09035 [Labilibaculum sp. K2S]|uniref:hypothetical protein n=1 Tax=Labilibaculum sp. K2S TaxID=3056386 RepID=UPI0025A39752|nr:hypothetical protein [Labilibaculum sp. K2S]MDM8159957.1 hypothetical protein [Labilibaculum sp. K2S]
MKTLKYLVLFFITIAICSCDKDDNEISKADFSVLGITSISVNNIAYSIDDNLLLKLEDSKNIAVTGSQITESTKHCVIEYSVLSTTKETPFVSAKSSCSGVSVNVDSNTTSDGITSIVLTVSRSEYKEQAIYKFNFVKI